MASPATEPAPPIYRPAGVSRPHDPERAPTYRLLEKHFDAYVFAHEERFEERHGALRAVVTRSVTQSCPAQLPRPHGLSSDEL